MIDKQRGDESDLARSGWDEGIRALIKGKVHHDMGGTRLHENGSERAESTARSTRGPAGRPSGKQGAKRTRRPSGGDQQREQRRAS
jgi:hypothetical protein